MNKNSNESSRFIKGIWITGNIDLNNEYFIGRTCVRKGKNSVALVTHSCATIYVPFEHVQNVKQLSIISKRAKPQITSSINNRNHIKVDERLIVEMLREVNNKN